MPISGIPIDRVHYNVDSPHGQVKQDLLTPERTITVRLPDRPTGLEHRLMWEDLPRFQKEYLEQARANLARCENAAEALAKYDANPIMAPPLRGLVAFWERIGLPAALEEPVEHGFDLDLLLCAEDPEDMIVRIEVFPRTKPGLMVTAYGSHLMMELPYNLNVGFNGSGTSFGNLPLYIAGTTEDAPKQFAERAPLWDEHEGLWPITDKAVATVFVNDMAFTLCEAMFDKTRPDMLQALVKADMSQGPEVRTGDVRYTHRR